MQYFPADCFHNGLLKSWINTLAQEVISTGNRVTLVGMPLDVTGIWVCRCGCAEGLQGSYTLVPDVELIAIAVQPPEYLRNTIFARDEYWGRVSIPDGREVAIIPGTVHTRTLWEVPK
jgi:hypothetical protein